jgi:hypothetical protein
VTERRRPGSSEEEWKKCCERDGDRCEEDQPRVRADVRLFIDLCDSGFWENSLLPSGARLNPDGVDHDHDR